MKSENELLASVITNTKKANSSRNLSIYDIAKDINALAKLKGGLAKVADITGVSTNMLNKFLSALKVSGETLNLLKSRKIDSVETVYAIAKYTQPLQDQISQYVLNGRLKSHDLRAISSFIKQHPGKGIEQAIEEFLATKNIKVSVIKFSHPDDFDREKFNLSICKMLNPDSIITITYDGQIGNLKIKKEGEMIIRGRAKENNFTLSQYIDFLIKLHKV